MEIRVSWYKYPRLVRQQLGGSGSLLPIYVRSSAHRFLKGLGDEAWLQARLSSWSDGSPLRPVSGVFFQKPRMMKQTRRTGQHV